jgi:enoyl-CoA hydratase/carnithine racemase
MRHAPRAPLGLAWWAEAGSLLVGAYPGHPDPALAEQQLDALLDAGVRVFVSLLEEGEERPRGAPPYDEALGARARRRGLAVRMHRFGVEDHDVPDLETLAALEGCLDTARRADAPVYLHCWGGRGRSGVVAALELVRRGLAAPHAALEAVAERRAGLPGSSPETPVQEAFVRRLAGRRPPAAPRPAGPPRHGAGPGLAGAGPARHAPGMAAPTRPDAASADAPLREQERDGVVTLILNRPAHFNALSEALLEHLDDALERLAGREDARVVVLAGAGRAFCAGHDLREMRAQPDEARNRALFARCSRIMQRLREIPQPVIARVHGVATAAGCQLVAASDLAVASESARFAASGIRLGLFCATPGVALSRAIPPRAAFEWLFTGDFVDAQEARTLGLVNRVVPDTELDAATAELAGRIARHSPVAVRMGKALFYRQLALPLPEAYALAGEVMARNLATEDAAEGIDAFLEKRDPTWRGR